MSQCLQYVTLKSRLVNIEGLLRGRVILEGKLSARLKQAHCGEVSPSESFPGDSFDLFAKGHHLHRLFILKLSTANTEQLVVPYQVLCGLGRLTQSAETQYILGQVNEGREVTLLHKRSIHHFEH